MIANLGEKTSPNKSNLRFLENLQFTSRSHVEIMSKPKPTPILSLTVGNSDFELLRKGNIGIVTGVAKSRKSHLLAILAAAFLAETAIENTLGFCAEKLAENEKLLYIDTEQDPQTNAETISRICKIAGVGFDDQILRYYSFIQAPINERIDYLKLALKAANDEQKPIKIAFLDGIADFVSNVNDIGECDEFVRRLIDLGLKYGTCFICVIHENQKALSGRGARGNLGSILERRAVFCASLETQKDDSTLINFSNLRYCGSNIPAVRAVFDSIEKRLCLSEYSINKQTKVKKAPKYDYEFWVKIFEGQKQLTSKQIYERLKDCGVPTASKRMIKLRGLSDGFILQPITDVDAYELA